MRIALGFGPKQLAQHVADADFDILSDFLLALANRIQSKTIHYTKTPTRDNVFNCLALASDYLYRIGDPYQPLKEDK